MSVGAAIVLSAVLLIVVWQVDKRRAWRSFGRTLVWLMACSAVVGSGIAGYVWWSERASEARSKNLISEAVVRLNSGELRQYWGIELGMARDEVLYRKGQPTQKREAGEGALEQWVWGDDPLHIVAWTSEGKVYGVLCAERMLGSCEHVASIGTHSFEREVLEILGPPAKTPKYEKGRKSLVYGREHAHWTFFLEQEHVRGIQLSAQ